MPPDRTPASSFVDDYLPALLALASHAISGEFHRVVVARGLTVNEWRVLACLADSNLMSTGDLARMSLTTQPTVTRVVDRLEARGEVVRVGDPSDRRLTLVQITPTGARMLQQLMVLAREHEARVLAPLGAQHADELKQALKLLSQHVLGALPADDMPPQVPARRRKSAS